MLFLEGNHKTIVDHLYKILSGAGESEKLVIGDYHGSQWCLRYDPDEGSLFVAVGFAADPKQLEGWGMQDMLKEKYGDSVVDPASLPEDMQEGNKYNAAVKVDLPKEMKEPTTKEDIDAVRARCVNLAELYYCCIAPAFRHAFTEVNSGNTLAPFKLAYRDAEGIYLVSTKDNLLMHTSMVFGTADELLFGRIFLQEFVDAKKHERSIAAAPGCDMSNKRPKEIAKVPGVEPEDPDHRLWVTIILQFPRHTSTAPAALKQTVEYLLNFRNYVQYHIKCGKTFMNQKMRARHAELLKVLARSKTDTTGQATVKLE